MKTRQSRAATFFGLTVAALALSVAASFLANSGKAEPETALLAQPLQGQPANPAPAAKPPAEQPEPEPAPATPALDPASVQKGKQNYDMFCLACHGAEDTTIDSPSNLFDSNWFHGSDRAAIERSIREGIYDKGMPGWGAMIPAEDITALVDYLISFQNQ